MAGRRLTANDILERLDNDEFGLSSGEESDFEGEELHSYLPPAQEDLSGHKAGEGALSREGSVSGRVSDDDAPSGPATGLLESKYYS